MQVDEGHFIHRFNRTSVELKLDDRFVKHYAIHDF